MVWCAAPRQSSKVMALVVVVHFPDTPLLQPSIIGISDASVLQNKYRSTSQQRQWKAGDKLYIERGKGHVRDIMRIANRT
ncbi:hypothetical protein E2C01_101859 [Portunus trituberculatus]|uniref:Uncharacterized protein n=1 Tax=Portunus trituberculatus TaxID=210409 RepID=A0A5B7KGY9_PORTR|nr:hypothetical protein [Portunus trituberculatus]